MPQCITDNPTTLDVESLEEAAFVYTVRVNATTPTIRIYFVPPRTATGVGAVTSVAVTWDGTAPGPDHGTDWIEFTTSQLGTTYSVVVTYTLPPRADSEDRHGPPLYTPTKSPKFKPQMTCPT